MSYLTLGLILLIGGMLIGFVAFTVAASNMGKSMSMRRHSLTMIPMALGGMTSFVGIVFIILHFVDRLTT
jgi:hypothetical protein